MEKNKNILKEMRKGYFKQLEKDTKFDLSKKPRLKKIIDKLTK